MSENPDLEPRSGGFGERPPRLVGALEGPLCALIMGVLVVITFANVVTRYFTSKSIAFTEEYSVFLMVVIALLGSASAFAGDKQLRVTFFVDRLRLASRLKVEYAVLVASIAFFILVTWYGYRYAYDEYRFEVSSPGLGHPQWIYTAALPIFSAVITMRLIGRLVRIWTRER